MNDVEFTDREGRLWKAFETFGSFGAREEGGYLPPATRTVNFEGAGQNARIGSARSIFDMNEVELQALLAKALQESSR